MILAPLKRLNYIPNQFIKFRLFGTLSKHKLMDIKNTHILIVQDQECHLPYLHQVQVKGKQDGQKYTGLVLKIESKKSYIGLYEPISSEQIAEQKELHIQTLKSIQNIPPNIQLSLGSILNCKFQKTFSQHSEIVAGKIFEVKPNISKDIKQSQMIESLSCVMTVCQDLKEGDMTNFQGPLKSKRTTQVQSLIISFTDKHNSNIGVYMNLSKNDSQRLAKNAVKCITFNQDNFTSTSAYSLAIKAIYTARYLSEKQKKNVLIVIDGLDDILIHQWNLLSTIQTALSPISIINQLHSFSQPRTPKSGSFTTMIVTSPHQPMKNIEHLQSISTHSNTIKHLHSLCHTIKFPLELRPNYNIKKNNQSKYKMRKLVNQLIREKNEVQLKRQLKLDRNEPWQYYFILDSEWWVEGLKTYKASCVMERNDFMQFLVWNIERQICSQWNKSASQVFGLFCNFCVGKSTTEQKIYLSQSVFEDFILDCRLNGLFNPFKKDYLP